MDDDVRDGQVRQVYNPNSGDLYKVTVPTGWVESHRNQKQLTHGYVWADPYTGTPSDIPELPDDIKQQLGLMNAPRDDDQIGQRREREGGKSKKRPTRRRRSSKARKARRSRKVRKARSTRRR